MKQNGTKPSATSKAADAGTRGAATAAPAGKPRDTVVIGFRVTRAEFRSLNTQRKGAGCSSMAEYMRLALRLGPARSVGAPAKRKARRAPRAVATASAPTNKRAVSAAVA